MKFGIIGCGGIADRRMIPGMLRSGKVEVVAIESPHIETVNRVGDKYGIATRYTDLDSLLLDSDVEAVYIATPVYLHLEQIIKSADAGKHILCEKPLAMNTSEINRIIDYCEKKGVYLQVGYMMRYHAGHKKIIELLKKGRIGKPVMGRAQLTTWYPPIKKAWRQDPSKGGGGALMDMALHCIDLLRYFIGEVSEVSSFNGTTVHNYPVEDSGIILLRFENGAYGVCESFFNIPDEAAKNFLELYGSHGSLLCEGTVSQNPGGKIVGYFTPEGKEYNPLQERGGIRGEEIEFEPFDPFQAEVEDFVETIKNRRKPMNSAEESFKNQTIVEAAYESQRTGRTIRISK